jgi:hypothetical protein
VNEDDRRSGSGILDRERHLADADLLRHVASSSRSAPMRADQTCGY